MNRKLIIAFFLFVAINKGSAQDLFDKAHSLKFAEYLNATGQTDLATLEYERLAYMDPSNDTIVTKAFQYFNQKALYQNCKNLYRLYPYTLQTGSKLQVGKAYVLSKDSIKNFLETSGLDNRSKNKLIVQSGLLNHDPAIINIIKANPDLPPTYIMLYEKGQTLRRRSPFLAGTFSSIVPGSGKAYAGNWKDGIFSFILVGGNAYQSYRGFAKNGISSIYGWVFGGLASVFYAGNIYGSVRTAKLFNKKQVDAYDKTIVDHIISD